MQCFYSCNMSPYNRNNGATFFVFLFCSENGCRWPFWMNENHVRSLFFLNSQNGCTENHFWSHFSPFQINMQFFFHKMAICNNFIYFFKWPSAILSTFFLIFLAQNGCRRPFWMTELNLDCISRHFRSIHNFFFHK